MKDLSFNSARIINQNKFKSQSFFSASFHSHENNQVLDEAELFNNLNNNQNLTETDFDNIVIKTPLENQIQQQEMKDSGWRFDKIISMTK